MDRRKGVDGFQGSPGWPISMELCKDAEGQAKEGQLKSQSYAPLMCYWHSLLVRQLRNFVAPHDVNQ